MCPHSLPPAAFIDAAVTPNEKAVPDVTPPLKTTTHLGDGLRKVHDSYIIVHVSILDRFHSSHARGLGRALRSHSMVCEKVLHLDKIRRKWEIQKEYCSFKKRTTTDRISQGRHTPRWSSSPLCSGDDGWARLRRRRRCCG